MAAPADPGSRPRLRVAADPRLLERELLREMALPAGADPCARTFVVAPTKRLLDHLELELTKARGALAGVHFFHHRGLASHLLAEAGVPEPAEASAPLLELLLFERLRPLRLELVRYLERQPAAIGALLSTLRDLRHAGVDAAAARRAPLSPRGRETVALLAAFEELLASLERQGATDGAGHAQAARRAAAERAAPCARLVHYGAYELIGVHRRLLQELTRRVPSTFLVAASDVAGPAQELAAAFDSKLESIGAPAPTRRARLWSAAGPREEMRLAVRTLLAWHVNDGVPFPSMAILARDKRSHQQALRAEAALQEIAPDTSFETSLADHPIAQRLRLLLLDSTPARHALTDLDRAAARDFRHAAAPAERIAGLARWARDAGGGALEETLEAAARELARHAAGLRSLAEPAALAGYLLRRLDEAPLDPDEGDESERRLPGGLRVLDLHQARALPFERAVLVGANDRLLPKRRRDDFFLGDADRCALREATGAPVPLCESTRPDEELLFDSVCAAVREELLVTFARAEGDRDAAPSLFLRRLGLDPETPELLVPRGPRDEHRALLAHTRLLTPQEALLEATAHRGAPRDLAHFARAQGLDAEAFEAGLARAIAVDDRDGTELRFDGAVIAARPRSTFAPTELERLGRCPLQYFFAHELELEATEEPGDGDLSRKELGRLLHGTLETLYRDVVPRDVPVRAATVGPLARERLASHFDRAAGRIPIDQRPAPRLWAVRREQLLRDLEAFVAADLGQMEALALRAGTFEEPQTAPIDLLGRALDLSLRIDRILVDGEQREWIADYKLARASRLKDRLKPAAAVQGRELQLALYRIARVAQGRRVAGLQLLSLQRPRPRDDGPFQGADLAEIEANDAEIRASLAVLLQTRDAGSFPLVSDLDDGDSHCGHCDFRRACRHSHGPTVARVKNAAANAAFYALAEKSPSKPAKAPKKAPIRRRGA
jgi:hypothetical protein